MYKEVDKSLICSDKCQATYYIDELTYSFPFCVPSCKNLIPTAYIDPTTADYFKCNRSCPAGYPHLDKTTTVDHPICVTDCPAEAPYKDQDTFPGLSVCVKSCKNLNPPAFANSTKCVRSCSPQYIDTSDEDNPTCRQCPTG